ncbi:MAG TPA: pilus assembly protein HicB [Verrucomicrobiales bacterium]|jgi:predicted RNase H-like HicB family nuclease|nr:pilus assembly protein HicB [Verrucomicrobiales bacterium]
MKPIDQFHKWVDWSEEDQVYIGRCPDLITGIHGDDPATVYQELCLIVEDVLEHLHAENKPIPQPRVRPMQDVT